MPTQPVPGFVADFIDAMNRIEARVVAGRTMTGPRSASVERPDGIDRLAHPAEAFLIVDDQGRRRHG
jgi:hypothetical protein